MTRPRTIYAAGGNGFAVPAASYRADEPTAGWYKFRLVRGGHPVAVRIWHGPPHCPDTGEEMDRSHRWQASANGRQIEVDRVWPACGRDPIDEAEAQHLIGLETWGRANAPDGPQANPHRPVDLLSAATPLPF